MIRVLHRYRATRAKKAFVTRRVPTNDMETLISGNLRPSPGDLLLATVQELGKHKRLELRNGRRARLNPGDEIVVAYGNRYAPDQFEALISEDLGACDLVAAGGIASREVCRHERIMQPTWIVPVGLIGRANGRRINLADYAIQPAGPRRTIKTVVVAGTAMNAGKTYTAASIMRGLKQMGKRVAGIKVTGTGAGGDLWHYRDMGADVVLDFTDAGYASTYKVSDDLVEEAALSLITQASRANCAYAVVEIADGLHQEETASLLRSHRLRQAIEGVVFAAQDAMGGQTGLAMLRDFGHRVLAISGALCQSPLAMQEATKAVDVPVHHPIDLQNGILFQPVDQLALALQQAGQTGVPTLPGAHLPSANLTVNGRVPKLANPIYPPQWSVLPQFEDGEAAVDEVESA